MIVTHQKYQRCARILGFLPTCLFVLSIAVLSAACGQNAGAEQIQDDVKSHLHGQITLSTEVDSVGDFSGFEILVAQVAENSIDTLAFTTTDSEGMFAMDINAPRSNIYRLVIGRNGSILRDEDIAISNGDSASLKVQFPFGRRPLMIRSKENAALLGFKNTVALHNAEIQQMSTDGVLDQESYAAKVYQTSEILWGLRNSSPGTLASNLASSESITMLESWNDSLLVARAKALEPDNVNYGAVVGAARRAQVRLSGLESGPALVEELKAKVTDQETLALIQSELVLAYRDSGEGDQALAEARKLKMENATDSSWIRWADRAIFDLENLRPGMQAPVFSLTDKDGNEVSTASFAGKYLVLEFYAPGQEFASQLTARNAFYRAENDTPIFSLLSISLQPDRDLNDAFFDGRDIPGQHVFLEDGPTAQIVKDYNVYVLPTRFLIDSEGNIVGKYVLGNGLNAFQDALTMTLANENG